MLLGRHQLDLQEHKVQQEDKVLKGLKDRKEHKVQQGRKEHKVQREHHQ